MSPVQHILSLTWDCCATACPANDASLAATRDNVQRDCRPGNKIITAHKDDFRPPKRS